MRDRQGRRGRRASGLIVAALVVAVTGVAGAWAGGGHWLLGKSSTPKAKSAPLWVAGKQSPSAAPKAAVPKANVVRPAAVKPAGHVARPAGAKAHGRRLLVARSIALCAKEGTAAMADGTTVPIWGFATLPTGATCADAAVVPQLPGAAGPLADVTVGDTVTINVTNALTARTISLEAPGLSLSGASDAAPGTTASVTFVAGNEGTFLLESSGDGGRQVAMGLSGVVIVRSATPNVVDGAAYNVEQTVVLSEIDPAFNAAPDTFNMNGWSPKYWLINGLSYPQTPVLPVAPGQALLLRYANAGIDNNTMTLLGIHERIVGEAGFPLASPYDVTATTFPSGETSDALVSVPAGTPDGTQYALYNRNMHLTNGTLGGANYQSQGMGGMMTFIRVAA